MRQLSVPAAAISELSFALPGVAKNTKPASKKIHGSEQAKWIEGTEAKEGGKGLKQRRGFSVSRTPLSVVPAAHSTTPNQSEG